MSQTWTRHPFSNLSNQTATSATATAPGTRKRSAVPTWRKNHRCSWCETCIIEATTTLHRISGWTICWSRTSTPSEEPLAKTSQKYPTVRLPKWTSTQIWWMPMPLPICEEIPKHMTVTQSRPCKIKTVTHSATRGHPESQAWALHKATSRTNRRRRKPIRQ